MDVLHLFQWTETREAVNKLHVLLKCRVCDALPVDPVVLPKCHHTFCAACLRDRPSCSHSNPHQCPLCSTTSSHLPTSLLPDNLTAQLCGALQDLQSLLSNGNHLPKPGDAPTAAQDTRSEAPVAPVACIASTSAHQKPILPKSTPAKPKSLPPTTEPKPATPQTKSAIPQIKPATPETKPATVQLKPTTPQTKQATVQLKPTTPQTKQATVQLKSITPQTKPATVQLKPTTPQPKSTTAQSGPVATQSKRGTTQLKPATPQTKPIAQGQSPTTHKLGVSTLRNAPSTPEVRPAGVRSVPATPKLDRRNLKGETALHSACVKGDEELVRRLLQEGANPNCRDHAGWTPLHEACQHGHVAIAEALLRAGALPNVPGYEGNATPLHDAVEHGRDVVIRTLRTYGARDDLRDMYGNTARDLALLCRAPEALLAALDTPQNAEAMRQVRNVGLPQHSVVLTGSSLTPDQSKQLHSLARLLRLRVVSEYCPEVSHVVVNCEGNRLVCLRTAKFMMAVVAGKWIVSHTWVQACLQQKSLVSCERFEVSGSSQNAASLAPTLARLNASSMLPGLLSGCHIYLHGNFKSDNCPSKRDLEGLVRAGGGRLLLREPKPESIPAHEKTVPYHASTDSCLAACSHYIIYLEGSDTEPKLKYDMAHIKSLPLSWLIDCVDHFKLLPPFHSVK